MMCECDVLIEIAFRMEMSFKFTLLYTNKYTTSARKLESCFIQFYAKNVIRIYSNFIVFHENIDF